MLFPPFRPEDLRPLLVFVPLEDSLTAAELRYYAHWLDHSWVDLVASYLACAYRTSWPMCLEPDAFDSRKGVSPSYSTDGVYYWHSSASDYVRRYRVEVPEAFIEHCLDREPVFMFDPPHEWAAAVDEALRIRLPEDKQRKRELWEKFDMPPPIDVLC